MQFTYHNPFFTIPVIIWLSCSWGCNLRTSDTKSDGSTETSFDYETKANGTIDAQISFEEATTPEPLGIDIGFLEGPIAEMTKEESMPSSENLPPSCDPENFIMRCSADQTGWVECADFDRREHTYTCWDDDVCIELANTAVTCVHPNSHQCYGPSARCENDVAFNCNESSLWEHTQKCVTQERVCRIISNEDHEIAVCVLPQSEICPFFHCTPYGCQNGLLLDCCNKHTEPRPCPNASQWCIESTNPQDQDGRTCLDDDFESCNPNQQDATCLEGQAINCYHYITREVCVEPNPMCLVIHGIALCSFPSASECSPDYDSMTMCLDLSTDVVCHWNGYEQAVTCPDDCDCLGYDCIRFTDDGYEICSDDDQALNP